ncbi:MAG: hypothetical protein KAI59_03670, partial [Planctomycetes bacterium]|nr:hypothetical protein [Planctomycetota bacterium]
FSVSKTKKRPWKSLFQAPKNTIFSDFLPPKSQIYMPFLIENACCGKYKKVRKANPAIVMAGLTRLRSRGATTRQAKNAIHITHDAIRSWQG